MQENQRAPIMTPNVEERGPRRPKSTFKVKTPQDSSMDESLDFLALCYKLRKPSR